MATIISTVDNISMSSTYTCTTTIWRTIYSGGQSTQVQGYNTSGGSVATQSITFNYSDIGTEKVNMAILSLTSVRNTLGGTFSVNGTKVYPSGGKYTVYLNPSDIGATSTTFDLSFITYTQGHSHQSGYDSKTDETVISISSMHHTYEYKTMKSHTGTLDLGDITLKIYTGDDSVAVPSISALFVGIDGVAKKVTDMLVGINGVAKKIPDAWIGINGIARKFWPCLELQNVTPGNIIKIDEAGDGTLVDYIVVAQDHYLNDINTQRHTVLMRKNVLNTTSNFGNNTYGEAYVGEALDTYINEAWKASLDGRIILKLMNITIPCNKWSSPYTSSAERQIWVPSRDEIDPSYTEKHEGPVFAYFENKTANADRIATTSDGTARAWWTRSCVEGMGSDGAYIRVITTTGMFNNYSQSGAFYCRPVFCLPANLPVSQLSEGTYDLIL